MNIYLPILKALLSFNSFSSWYSKLNLDFLSKNFTDLSKLFLVLPKLHASGTEKTYTPLDLKLCVLQEFPRFNEEILDGYVSQLVGDTVDSNIIEDYLRSMAERSQALEVARVAIAVSEGQSPLSSLRDTISEIPSVGSTENSEDYLVPRELSQLLDDQVLGGGLFWRLESLNRALGPLRKGDFGFLFARPETGKTTFLASECSFFASQLKEDDGPVLWFNNEEGGKKVMLRCYQAALGKALQELEVEPENIQGLYLESTHDKLVVVDCKVMSAKLVESICRELNPSMIVFDQIDKIKGFSDDRYDLEMKSVYGWARELASQYGPVIGVCQAGGSGENKQWLTMNDVDSSKTAKQGEADWILGIGYVFDFGKEQVRYFHLSKNKLLGSNRTDPTMRHGKWSCYIQPEIARYKDFNNDGTIS